MTRKYIDVSDYADGKGYDETAKLKKAVDAWNNLIRSMHKSQYPNVDSVPLYFPPGVWAGDIDIIPEGTGGVIYGSGINSQLDHVSINISHYRCSVKELAMRGSGSHGLKMSDIDGSGTRLTNVNNVWIRDRAEGLCLTGDFAWSNFSNLNIEKCGRSVSLLDTNGVQMSNVHAVNPTSDYNLFVAGGGELKINNFLGMNAIKNNLRITGSQTVSAVEHYFNQCTFTNAQKNRIIDIEAITNSNGNIKVKFKEPHELAPRIKDLTLEAPPYSCSCDVISVIDQLTVILSASYVSDSLSGSVSLPNWDILIDVDEGAPTSRVNDIYFNGGNANFVKIDAGFNISFNEMRLKQQVWISQNRANRIKFNRQGRGRDSTGNGDILISGSNSGWSEIVTLDDSGSINAGGQRTIMRSPNKNIDLVENLPTLNELEVNEDEVKLSCGGTSLIVDSSGVRASNTNSGKAATIL